MDLQILFEDSDITVCVKPRGILSEDAQNGEKGIIGLLSDRAGKPLHLLHRLDRNVSGVMVFANNKKSAAALSRAIQEGRFYKVYLAVTDGEPAEQQGVYKDLLFKDSKKNRSYVVNRMRKGVREASLEYKVRGVSSGKAMVQILLHTGRTHQIRVQFSSRKTPLAGDIKYGSKDRTTGDVALHSYRIRFNHPANGGELCFSADPDFSVYPWNLFGGDTDA
ncbi:MAG: RluA family pseudouridine synthase [Clostridia bacterium]|nr:RluA family pseudouridine synthase [Clostridia bacterium]